MLGMLMQPDEEHTSSVASDMQLSSRTPSPCAASAAPTIVGGAVELLLGRELPPPLPLRQHGEHIDSIRADMSAAEQDIVAHTLIDRCVPTCLPKDLTD